MAQDSHSKKSGLKVLTIVLNWNGWSQTVDCLRSLEKVEQTGFSHEIVLVDNNSSDGSVAKIRKMFPGVHLVVNQTNLGFAGGNNVGLKYALGNNADFIFILNNDTIVDPRSVQLLLETAQREKEIGAVAPKIYFSPGREFHPDRYRKSELGKVIWFAGGEFDWDNIIGSHRGVDEVDRGQFDRPTACDFISGCAMFLKSEVLKSTGLFDENYFLYLEDADLSYRIKTHGYRLVFDPRSIVWHKNAASQGRTGSALQDYFIIRNRLYFAFKFAKFRTKAALVREGFKLLLTTRRQGVIDFIFGRMSKGSWE